MANRFRIEIYDDIKANDITLYSEQGMDRENLSTLILSYVKNFQGNIKAYVFDNVKKRKIVAAYVPMELANINKSKMLVK